MVHPAVLGSVLAVIPLIMIAMIVCPALSVPLRFVFNCFIKPFLHTASAEQSERLDEFYKGQADVYDKTRSHLLKGRETMLQLLASHLKAQPVKSRSAAKPKIWVDIGGGTGWNIEKM
jgi:betaine lipid synthase